jgi:anti-sigma B factor antagonist
MTSPGQRAGLTSGDHLPESFLPASEPIAADLLRLDVRKDPSGTTTIRALGEIDLITSPLLRDRVLEQLREEIRKLVLDLRQVDFLASSGLAVLVEIRTEALKRGIALRLVTASRSVLRPLAATGLLALFDIDDADDIDDAG